MKSDSF